ncbi:GreA/GreB family elongation factor [Streptomyces sp. KLOTTS4A1]|uniref:GreA/GreB family elongation factor n=1 Tax=Streptomyces sp. KLOTTS4A1 TaxID=3390996 RepID=UPI0039F4D3C3
MNGGPEPISAVAREALLRELNDLRIEREAVAATLRGGGGDETGDRADQADELMRATELDRLDARIDEIEVRLRTAATAGAPSAGVVGVGSTVTVRFADGTEATLHIGEIADAEDHSLVTADSPLGRALLGHRAHDAITYDTPQGTDELLVLAVADA